jgi:hypothetical protein
METILIGLSICAVGVAVITFLEKRRVKKKPPVEEHERYFENDWKREF